MKRTELRRGTPLARVSSLRSGSVLRRTRQQQGCVTPLRSSRINPVSRKRIATQPSRRRAESLLGRDRYGNGICARCGQHGPVNGHERRGRSQGGDPTKPDCLLCVPCNTWCEDNPVTAVALGWKVSRKYSHDLYLGPNQAVRSDSTLHYFTGVTP